jgi:hypothetical protein
MKQLTIILSLFYFGAMPTYGQQKWMELRDQGANFYDIKKAFYEQNKTLIDAYNKDTYHDDNPQNTDLSSGTHEGVQAEHEKEEYQDLIHYFRWAEWIEPRVMETKGDISALIEADYQARLAQKRTLEVRGAANWTVVGPISIGTMSGNGRVNSIKVDPASATTFYASSPGGQLWKSTNSGGSWTVISDGIPAAGVTDMAIDPTNSNILYALTGDSEGAIYHPTSRGLYKSINGGLTWSTTGLNYPSGGTRLATIIIHPTLTNIILVGGSNGIWRSTNGGTSFTRVNTTDIRELVFNPINPNTVFAAGKSTATLLRSYDGGVSWMQITTGLPMNLSTTTPVATLTKRFSIDVSKVDTNYIYLMASNGSDNMEGFYRSTDAGTSFTQMVGTSPNIPNGQGWYNMAVAADPVDVNTVYAAGLTVYKSINGGTTFTSITIPHVDVHDLQFNGTDLLAASDGGVYKRNTILNTWTNISSNLAIAQPYSIGVSQTTANMLLSGHQDNGTNLTTNATSWKAVSGGDGMVCFVDRTTDNTLFMTYQNGVLRRSLNGGTSSSTIYTVPNGFWVTPFIQDPVATTTFYTGGYEVYKSVDNGTTWAAITVFGTTTPKQFRWLDVCRTNNQIIYAMTSSQLYKTVDGGTIWTEVTAGLPTGVSFMHVHIDFNNPNAVYLSSSSTSGKSVYYTNNGGTTWTNISAGLPNIAANTVTTQFGSWGVAYCGTDLGVYYRNPSVSASWQSFNAGLPAVPVRDLEIQYSTNRLFAGTFGRSIWVSPLEAAILPVELIDFQAQIYNPVINQSSKNGSDTDLSREYREGVLLTWQTAQETRFNHFEIERSTDSKTWQYLAEVKAKGGQGSGYQTIDQKPHYGINYYRLKMVDNDGTFDYSKIVSVDWTKPSSTNWALFPNPVKDKLFVTGNEDKAGEQTVLILDSAGKLVAQTTIFTLRNGFSINNLPNGTYFLDISDKTRQIFVVNR